MRDDAMKIKFIAPHEQSDDSISSAQTFKIQKVNLPLLAALTPPKHSVKIVDEAFAPDDMNGDVDLVGITVMTELALRAYHIADTYRNRGVKVVMGGIHPTVLPYEALGHADSVVVGEGEDSWPRLVEDAESGRMQKIYRAARRARLNTTAHPRRDLYPRPTHKGYTPLATGVETARGCPYNCEFCSIGSVMGRQYRSRPMPEVIAEMESIDSPHLFFVDDAIGLNRVEAKKLFSAMVSLRRIWAGQGTVSLAEDLELIKLMKRSGCLGLLVGFESIQKQARDGMKKIGNLKIDFSEALRRFHGEGLAVLGAFIFGFDHENKDVFDQTLEFTMKNHLDCVEFRILTPLPGTRIYTRLLNEGRLFVPDWWLRGYSSDTLLFQPRSMTVDELLEGFARLNRQVYSLGGVIKRFFGMSPWKRTVLGCSVHFGLNLATRKRYIKSLGIPQPFAGASGQEEEKAWGVRKGLS